MDALRSLPLIVRHRRRVDNIQKIDAVKGRLRCNDGAPAGRATRVNHAASPPRVNSATACCCVARTVYCTVTVSELSSCETLTLVRLMMSPSDCCNAP